MRSVEILVELDPAVQARIDELAALFEGAPDLIRQCLLDRVSRLLSSGPYLGSRTALRAGQHVVIVEFLPGVDQEFVAIAACAAQRVDVCHGCPSRKVV